ncbi:D-serine deaminase-like pyridoxal phosphate-dependent protein [Sediminihabitans luteus]|uniref:D-serine deaminase-like pyridoxal phosphate-dependent protein n=1 Tax=Sediminihabitans luteus TaxID=1138585 RepID=A0A2M9CE43_9CELL|nr:alanine racemase [Sediminihabitans luteus]PJJ70206.1 D-serine deaminase-like pyridoxal phosphate-dependent protein [Sediminihabitans luteus]GII97677.1 alanine racemase [Sediminihabitans luteus]
MTATLAPSAPSATTETLGARLDAATAALPAPLAVVDLDRFDANARDLVRRAGGVPIRVASKSVRVRALLDLVLALDGFAGVMAYSLAEALWLVDEGVRDVLVAYPTVDRDALARLAASPAARAEITVMVDHPDQVALVARALAAHGTDAGATPPVRLAIDVDASLRVGIGPFRAHLGVRRSPVRTPDDAAALARTIRATPGTTVHGVMFYEAQVAGLPDTRRAVRGVKRLSVRDLATRRRAVVEAVEGVVGHRLAMVNSGGTGSLETSSADDVVTEVTAGSGLYVPGLFDHYRAFTPRPAAFFGLDVVRLPAPGYATLFAGGYVASGEVGVARQPRVAEQQGWELTPTEAVGEVQTPLRAVRRRRGGAPRRELAIGDRVWFRHAKAGELMERFDTVHLVRGTDVVEGVPTYRGEGRNFG